MQTHVARKHPHGCFYTNASNVVGCNTSSAASAPSSSPSWPQSLCNVTTSLLLSWHSSSSEEILARFFYFGFPCSCTRREWLQSIEQSIRWINYVWNTDELFDLFFPSYFFPSFFSPLFFIYFSSSFYFLLCGHEVLKTDVCTLCSHVLTPVLIPSRFSILIVVHQYSEHTAP